MAITVHAAGTTSSVSTSPVTISGASITTSAFYGIDLYQASLASTDQFRVTVSKKVLTGGSEVVVDEFSISAEDDERVVTWGPTASPYSISFAIVKVAGTDRAFDYLIWGP